MEFFTKDEGIGNIDRSSTSRLRRGEGTKTTMTVAVVGVDTRRRTSGADSREMVIMSTGGLYTVEKEIIIGQVDEIVERGRQTSAGEIAAIEEEEEEVLKKEREAGEGLSRDIPSNREIIIHLQTMQNHPLCNHVREAGVEAIAGSFMDSPAVKQLLRHT